MKDNVLWYGTVLIVAALLSAGSVYSDSRDTSQGDSQKTKKPAAAPPPAAMDMEKAMAVAAKYAEPGQYHQYLKPLEGTWDAAVKMWMGPGAPIESKGLSEHKLILGGRFLQQEYKAEFMGKPFMGVGLTGYDNYKKEYTAVWLDTMSTGIWSSRGTCDGSGKVITSVGPYDDPVTGTRKQIKTITRVVDNNKHTFEWYEEGPDGAMHKTMEATYTRK